MTCETCTLFQPSLSTAFAVKNGLGNMTCGINTEPIEHVSRPTGMATSTSSQAPILCCVVGLIFFLSACRVQFRDCPFIGIIYMLKPFRAKCFGQPARSENMCMLIE